MKIKIPTPLPPDHNLLQSLERVAMLHHGSAMAAVTAFHRELEQDGQIPILIQRDADIPIPCALQSTWMSTPPPPVHLVLLAPQDPYQESHAIAHQLVHLRRQWEAIQGHGLFTPCINLDQMLACAGVSPRHRDHDRRSQEAKEVSSYLYNTIMDILVENRLSQALPQLSASQHHWALRQEFSRAQSVFELHLPDADATPALRRAFTAVSGAAALAWDQLVPEAGFAGYYQKFPEYDLSEKIFAACQRFLSKGEPNMGHSLVNEVADLVRLPNVFSWEPAPATQFPDLGDPSLN